MTECGFCGEEFESEQELHLHWGEEHGDELNSHQEDKAKKAEKEREERKKQKKRERKRIAGQLLAGAGALVVIALLGMQMLNGSSGGTKGASFELKNQPFQGEKSANVTVVEFGDYRCPYCRQFDQQIYPKLKQDYIDTGKIRFYFMNYAFLGPGSTQAAVAGECVYNQDREAFWNFHHAIYENQGRESERWVSQEFLMSLARDATSGLDYQKLRSCIANRKTLEEVRADKRQGSSSGVTGTPSVFVNGDEVSNPLNYGVLKAAIEEELEP